jgi:hypothetical protein
VKRHGVTADDQILMFRALKMDKSSLKSSNIGGRFLHLVSRKGKGRDRVHTFGHGYTLPFPVFISLQVFMAGVGADYLVHVPFCTTPGPSVQCGRPPEVLRTPRTGF